MRNTALAALHAHTPDVVAKSSLDLPVLALRLLRHPDIPLARWLLTRTEADLLTRTARVFGARPLRVAPGSPLLPDSSTVVQLDGQQLKLHTADGDSTRTLTDSAGRPLWAQNAQDTFNTYMYEAPNEGGRPSTTLEQAAGGVSRQRERVDYAAVEAANRSRNLAGCPIEQFDNAGVIHTRSRSLTDQVLETRRHLLCVDAGLPDWAGDSEDELETSPWLMKARHDATGAVLEKTNAADVTTLTTYDISGAVCEVLLGDANDQAVVLRDVRRRADGTVLSQTAGNGVVDTYAYSPITHRLSRHQTARPSAHPQGALVICDLHYQHDPVGNLRTLDDQGADPGWFRNRQVSGLREFRYDTLYRLASATGRERVPVAGFWSAAFSAADRQGGSVWNRYSERYGYDDGDNLTHLEHSNGWRSRALIVSSQSNRALPQGHDLLPDTGFLPGGLQKQLADGRPLEWLADNQLRQVRLVVRDGGAGDDTERYHYADGGTRTRKVTTATTASARQTTITTYLEGCEIRQRRLDGQTLPQQHVVISETSEVRWVHDRVSGEVHVRYAISDHLGSVGGETDHEGKLVSREEYAPFGESTGLDEGKSDADGLTLRTWRYSGKELDITGLYYYGWRYYQPGLARWLSADPAGLVDGANLYRMVRSNPLRYQDNAGLSPTEAPDDSGWFSSEASGSTPPAPTDVDAFTIASRVIGITIGIASFVLANLPYIVRAYHIATEDRTRPFSMRRLRSAVARNARTLKGATSVATAIGDGIGLILEVTGLLLMTIGANESGAMSTFMAGAFLSWIVRGASGVVNITQYARDPESLMDIPLAHARTFSPHTATDRSGGQIRADYLAGDYRSNESTLGTDPQPSVEQSNPSGLDSIRPSTSGPPPGGVGNQSNVQRMSQRNSRQQLFMNSPAKKTPRRNRRLSL
ncbi:RHS repeat-associated core domain-containing protein [Pseudomonas sp. CC120222-01a]|uniref:RHS repeat-associated core domain-containing protein n=1 Tax=Pseudomonas sp. CC120222-01a TaxID=1378075 RepID=UPI000D9D17FB|nr:RHS repeat-associated core domain-containing protein [Pseudomonas sp. CC120222-01a]PVZ42476.1 RHS repeat-associated protein [Pseudomonas sp. CC120222-01a]